MGLEARCTVRHRGAVANVKALLETSEVIVRGEVRLTIPLREIRSVRAQAGRLTIAWAEGPTVLELGADAEKWAKKIANPKSLIDKLGVKPGQRVSVLGIDDSDFLRQLAGRTTDASIGRIAKGSAMVFLGVTTVKELLRVATAVRALPRDGAVWVVWPKGRAELKEDHVRAAALAAGLVDVKVVAFSATLSALKLVIPVAKRERIPRGSPGGLRR